MLTRPDQDVPLDGAPLVALRVALTLAAAALSYRFVETPLRRDGFGAVRNLLASIETRLGRPARLATGTAAAMCIGGLVVAVAVMPARPAAAPAVADTSTATAEDTRATSGPPLLFVGDSVMLVAAPELQATFGARATIDAAVGRRFPEGAEIVLGRLRSMPPETVVVVHLGNNYFIDPADLDAFLSRLADRPAVHLLTTRVPLTWQESVNTAVRGSPAQHPNVSVIDWHGASGEPGLLVDGAHTSPEGSRRYADLIARALEPSDPNGE
jgi:hypothetical protein